MKKQRSENKGNFWSSLAKPFFVIAPMANVTDYAFRQMFAKYGKPDVMWTEFVSADGLISAGQAKLLHDLKFNKKERPIVAQLFTSRPEVMRKAATLIAKLGFDGLDINMGCPDRAVEKNGGGAAMIRNPKLALEVLAAARKGVTSSSNLPVSVKTRLGYNKIDLNWIKLLLEQHLPVLTVHLRTRKEMSDVPAHWEIMPEIIKLRNEISPKTLIIGNGDVASLIEARKKVEESGCDGIMIGRGIFGKPWFFAKSKEDGVGRMKIGETKNGVSLLHSSYSTLTSAPSFRLKVLVEHAKLFEKTFKGIKSFDVMKKHFKAYVSGWEGAKELRVELMNCKNAKELATVISRSATSGSGSLLRE